MKKTKSKAKKVRELNWIDLNKLTPAERKRVKRNWEQLLKYLFDEDVKIK